MQLYVVSPTNKQICLYCSIWIRPCRLLYTGFTKIHITPTSYEHAGHRRTSSLFIIFLFFVISKTFWTISWNYSNTYPAISSQILRPTGATGRLEGKLDDVLLFYSGSLRDILQREALPEKHLLVPNNVKVMPTHLEPRRPINETQPVPGQWRRNADGKVQCGAPEDVARTAAEFIGPVTAAAGSVVGHTDHSLPKYLGVQRKTSSQCGKCSSSKFLKGPRM